MAHEHQAYPSVRYHKSGATRIVHTEEESKALDPEEWSDAPTEGVQYQDPKHGAKPQPTGTGEYAEGARAKPLKARTTPPKKEE